MNWKRAVVRSLALVAVLALLVVSVAGCKAKLPAGVRTELNVRLWYGAAKQFDPSVCASAPEYYVFKNIFNGLVRFKAGSFEIQPDLASSWDISADGTVITFNLRKGVQFQKGYGEMTSEDIVFTFERLKNPKCEMSYLFGTVIDKIEAVGDHTVKMTLYKPFAPIFTYLAYRNASIVSKKAVTELGDGFAKNPVGTGPFAFQEMTEDKKVILTGFQDYYEGASQITKITFWPITDDGVAAMALMAGELDVMWTRGDATVAEQLEADPNISVVRASVVTTRFVGLNPSYKPLSDVNVRWALALAVDRQSILEATGGLETPAKSIFNPLFFGYTEDVPDFSYNLVRAKELLAQAGYPNGFDLTLLCTSASPNPLVAQVIQQSWQALGINVTLNQMEQQAYVKAQDNADFQAVLIGVGRPPDPDLVLMEAFHSSAIGQGRPNHGFYRGADALIEQAAIETDTVKRAAEYKDIATKIINDMPMIPISNTRYAAAWRLPVIDYIPGINNEFNAYTIKLGDEKPK